MPISRKDYLDALLQEKPGVKPPRGVKHQKNKKKKIRSALKQAHTIRMFEIEHYWKRALYFWGFFIALFSGYFLILTAKVGSDIPMKGVYLFSIAIAGVIISIAWYYMEKGSKAHMKNWEKHIDYLEYQVTGHLYKTNIAERDDTFFSPSTINRTIIILVGYLWLLLSYIPVWDCFHNAFNTMQNINLAYWAAGLFALCWLFASDPKFFLWKTSSNTIPQKPIIKNPDADLHQREYNP